MVKIRKPLEFCTSTFRCHNTFEKPDVQPLHFRFSDHKGRVDGGQYCNRHPMIYPDPGSLEKGGGGQIDLPRGKEMQFNAKICASAGFFWAGEVGRFLWYRRGEFPIWPVSSAMIRSLFRARLRVRIGRRDVEQRLVEADLDGHVAVATTVHDEG